MKILVTESQLKIINQLRENQAPPGRAFTDIEVKLFKYVNKYKSSLETEKKMVEFFHKILAHFNIPKSMDHYYYSAYVLSYREDGRYDLVTAEEFEESLSQIKKKKTTNKEAGDLVRALIPFDGNKLYGKPDGPGWSNGRQAFNGVNLHAQWESDGHGKKQYVVISYQWYPIFIYKNHTWFEVDDKYSNTTRRHMSNISYKLGQPTTIVTKDEIKAIRYGTDFNKLIDEKFNDAMENLQPLIGKSFEKKSFKNKVSFKIIDIVRQDNQLAVHTELLDIKVADPRTKSWISIKPDIDQADFDDHYHDRIRSLIQEFLFSNAGVLTSPSQFLIKMDLTVN